MSRTTRVMDCTPEDVFAVLEDGWSYGMWVVGAARIRDVDAGWPEVGSRIHHSVGAWPVLLSDNTEVEQVDRPRVLQLRVKAWPTGEGRVVLTMQPADGGGTEVVMEESAVSGPATLIPKPAEDFLLHHRNVEALRRLCYLAEHHARSRD
ncbi:MAG TPA: SRPBCC family protein [Nocardioidaceae bacterium]